MLQQTSTSSTTDYATNDTISMTETQLLSSGLLAGNVVTLDVLANDTLSSLASIYSIDDAVGSTAITLAQLQSDDLKKDATISAWETLATGDRIRIVNGKIELDLSASLARYGVSSVSELGTGQNITVSFAYSVDLGVVSKDKPVDWAMVTFTLTGSSNSAPVVTGAVTASVFEDGALSNLDALANASDPDGPGKPFVVLGAGPLPPGVTYNADLHQFTLNPAVGAYQSLAQGQTTTVTVDYSVSDGIASTPASVSWTVTGTNDAPKVTGAVTGSIVEDGRPSTLNALANATDIDGPAKFTIILGTDPLPPGVTYNPDLLEFTLNPAVGAYQSLAKDQTTTVTVNYRVSDGLTSTPASVSWTVTGVNDAPKMPTMPMGTATEDGADVTLDALAGATDIDGPAPLSVTGLPASLPAGVTYDAASHSFTLDPGDAAYQSLGAGEKVTVSVNYSITDGLSIRPAMASWEITGTTDAPTVQAGVFEDGPHGSATGLLVLPTKTDTFAAHADEVNGYGTFHFDAATGIWSFLVDKASPLVQALHTGQTSAPMTFTLTNADGSVSQAVEVVVHGRDPDVSFHGLDAITLARASFDGGQLAARDSLMGPVAINAVSIDDGFDALTIDANGHWNYQVLDLAAIDLARKNGETTMQRTFVVSTAEAAGSDPSTPWTHTITITLDLAQWDPAAAPVDSDTVLGSAGDDQLFAGAGNSYLFSAAGNDTVAAGDGADTVVAWDGDDYVDGGRGNDFLRGDAGNDTLVGGGGQDWLMGGTGNDVLVATADTAAIPDGGATSSTGSRLYGEDGDDLLVGGANGDALDGAQGNDTLLGGGGNDALYGGDGNDLLMGGAGNDMMQVHGDGTSLVFGGDGNDRYIGDDFSPDSAGGHVLLDGGAGRDTLLLGLAGEAIVLRDRGGIDGLQGTDAIGGFDLQKDFLVLDSQVFAGLRTIEGTQLLHPDDLLQLSDVQALDSVFNNAVLLMLETEVFSEKAGGNVTLFDLWYIPAGGTGADGTRLARFGDPDAVEAAPPGADRIILTGATTGEVREDGLAFALGTVPLPATGAPAFQAPTSLAGLYGQFTFDAASGDWTYVLDNGKAAVNRLSTGGSLQDSLTVHPLDPAAPAIDIQVTIRGAQDPGTSAGDSAHIDAASPWVVLHGVVSVHDVDNGEAVLSARDLTGQYGTFTFEQASPNTDGPDTLYRWTYTLDPSKLGADAFAGGDLADRLDLSTYDRLNRASVDVAIHAPGTGTTIAGQDYAYAQAIDEGRYVLAQGTLAGLDLAGGTSTPFVEVPIWDGQARYGVFSIDAAGHWTYEAGTKDMPAGELLQDQFQVSTVDGATHWVTVMLDPSGQWLDSAPSAGNDILQSDSTTLGASEGNDWMALTGASVGLPVVSGGAGSDALGTANASGTPLLDGGAGADLLVSGEGDVRINGGFGDDVLSTLGQAATSSAQLSGGAGHNTYLLGAGQDVVRLLISSSNLISGFEAGTSADTGNDRIGVLSDAFLTGDFATYPTGSVTAAQFQKVATQADLADLATALAPVQLALVAEGDGGLPTLLLRAWDGATLETVTLASFVGMDADGFAAFGLDNVLWLS